ncbi:PAS domain-containing hybrid sensor histidine kinase/response regulator [Rhizobium deserti]|uniref:PAS domain-containing hybrid sensor histidine kinase/response regulator n=1 Tax=Rhizobium deserti TaxID=2547961 RepID=UPI001FE1541A|nr:PAS domain-containing hybrid sensor histidine kinase/response regulator [Rhizobium deserti]
MEGSREAEVELDDLLDLFENAPCGYISASPDGRIKRANKTFASWLGTSSEKIVGRRFIDFLTMPGKIYFETHFAPLITMQGVFNEVALDLVKADGSRLPSLVNAVARREDSGDIEFIRITIFNATDRRRYEQELLEARAAAQRAAEELKELNATLEERVALAVQEKTAAESALHQAQKIEALGHLTGGVAHDFNNMLAVVIGGLNMAQRRIARGNVEDVPKLLAAAMDGATRAATLTQRLLAFSRQQPLSPEPVDANKLVANMAEILNSTLGEIIDKETVLAAGLWRTKADANQLENSVLNLAVNARDAMPEGGKLTIETANTHIDEAYASQNDMTPGQYVMIAVTDTGTGMPPDIIKKAIDPFFTTKPVGKGTGLGLSQVFGFAKQSGGHFKIYSEVGQGTTMKIYLPRDYGTEEVNERVRNDSLPHSVGSELILLVEDDASVREVHTRMLEELGYGVLAVENPLAALEQLERRADITLLFTDIVMAPMNGRKLADQARINRPNLPVVFTTGYTRNAVVHNGVLDPGVIFLQKPTTLGELARKIREAIDQQL